MRDGDEKRHRALSAMRLALVFLGDLGDDVRRSDAEVSIGLTELGMQLAASMVPADPLEHHDVAGELAGVELGALSRFQLCALAHEALAAAHERSENVRERRLLTNALAAVDPAIRHFD